MWFWYYENDFGYTFDYCSVSGGWRYPVWPILLRSTFFLTILAWHVWYILRDLFWLGHIAWPIPNDLPSVTIHETGVLFKTYPHKRLQRFPIPCDRTPLCNWALIMSQYVAKWLSLLSLLQAPLVEAKTKPILVRRVNSALVNCCGVFFVLPWYVWYLRDLFWLFT